jgi:hypothetical protein
VSACTHDWQRDGLDPGARKCGLCGVLGLARQSGQRQKFANVSALECRTCKAPATTRGVRQQRTVPLCDFCGSVGKAGAT